jgi:hypothetical protein
MKRLSWKYIAGLIDGEGCLDVIVSKDRYIRPRVRVCLTESSKFLLDMLYENFGGGLYYRQGGATWNGSYSWELSGYKPVCMFLRNIQNHCYIKQEQVRFLLWSETNIKGKWLDVIVRDTFIDELKAMKRDPHRLSVEAVANVIKAMENRSDSRISNDG